MGEVSLNTRGYIEVGSMVRGALIGAGVSSTVIIYSVFVSSVIVAREEFRRSIGIAPRVFTHLSDCALTQFRDYAICHAPVYNATPFLVAFVAVSTLLGAVMGLAYSCKKPKIS